MSADALTAEHGGPALRPPVPAWSVHGVGSHRREGQGLQGIAIEGWYMPPEDTKMMRPHPSWAPV